MFKDGKGKEQDEPRIVTKSFSGTGAEGYNEGDVFVNPAGVTLPPHMKLNSEPFTGHVPHNARRFDPVEYAKANTPRPEPAAPVMLTEADIKRTRKWSDAQWAAVVANGFPKSNAYREAYDKDGYPAGRIALWSAEDVAKWEQALTALRLR